ncbi:MAG TPA: MCE family protein [Mycobacterium sp.]
MRTLEPPNRLRIGIMGLVVLGLATAAGQAITNVPMLYARPAYYGQLTDSGQLHEGDNVRMAGMTVGAVQGLSIQGDHVLLKFTVGNNPIGTETRLAVKTDTILGKKVVEVEPRGTKLLKPGETLPIGQATTPYQIYDAIFDVTKAASGWPIDTIKGSLKILSQTVQETSPHLSAALDGVAEFSDTVAKRDEEVKNLLTQANSIASVLGDRSEQVDKLLVNTKTLLVAFNQRAAAIDALLGNVTATAAQLRGLIQDNPNLNHVLEQLRTVTDDLVERKELVVDIVTRETKLITELNEAVASGPYFKVTATNFFTAFQTMQPWLDAAFKKRGLLPEEFWRNAGLPEFRYPDPNGTRFANGAPPPAPTLLEGTPEHPGPAVVPGSPCSFAPGAGNFPTQANPLPCAGLDQNLGPFGQHGGLGPYPSVPDVLASPPNPDGVPFAPGISVGGRPNTPGPVVPGTPVPLAPAPPGARMDEPPGPISGPMEGNPSGVHGPPLAPPTGPLGRGPNDQVPVPQIPVGEGGNSQPGGGGGAADTGR